MWGQRAVFGALMGVTFAGCALAWAGMTRPPHPETDPAFLILPDGTDLRKIKVSGVPLDLVQGTATPYTQAEEAEFRNLRAASQARKSRHPVQWVLMDLDYHRVIDSSAETDSKIFGASVSKVFVGATLLDQRNGQLDATEKQLLADMLVVSSNEAWYELQKRIGNGNDDLGRERIQNFTERMGYRNTRGFQGMWGKIHGNELTARDTAEFLYDTYWGRYPGAEVLWKVLHTSRTGATRARKYLPAAAFFGGKTGTYDGDTIDPDTGSSNGPDGKPYTVQVRHQILVFNLNGREYALTIFADTGSDESAALLAGGLYRMLQTR